ncbi:MAG TPA: MBL fold metallo-hydrolase [Polyangia bacterium]
MSTFGKRAQGERLERVQGSPRFIDGAFRNTHPVTQGLKKGSSPVLWDFFFGGSRRTPTGAIPSLDPRPRWATAPETGLRTTWLGHSTVLVEIDGARVLTDPVWGPRASPVGFAGPKRFAPAPVSVEQLPALDVVIISHDHYDHLDLPTIKQLIARDVPFVTSLGVGAHLEAWGVRPERITELDWWQSTTVGGLTLTAGPAQHFSGRGIGGGNLTLWSSFTIEGARHRVFFSGDTGLTPEYEEIRARFGTFDLVMLEVGAFHPAWGDIHLGPENALTAHAMLGSGTLLPVHWGTFNLALHAWDEPAETILSLAEKRGTPLVMPRLGEAIEPARRGPVDPWWRAVDAPAVLEAVGVAR